MKYMLVYQPGGAAIFEVSRLSCRPDLRRTTLVFTGSDEEAVRMAESLKRDRRAVRTAHLDQDGDIESRRRDESTV